MRINRATQCTGFAANGHLGAFNDREVLAYGLSRIKRENLRFKCIQDLAKGSLASHN